MAPKAIKKRKICIYSAFDRIILRGRPPSALNSSANMVVFTLMWIISAAPMAHNTEKRITEAIGRSKEIELQRMA